jgi:hypothetical protein
MGYKDFFTSALCPLMMMLKLMKHYSRFVTLPCLLADVVKVESERLAKDLPSRPHVPAVRVLQPPEVEVMRAVAPSF